MHKHHWKLKMLAGALSAIAVNSATAAPFVTDQQQAKGFVEDSSLTLLLRNYYFNRNNTHGANDSIDWTQGAIGTFSSGFTQGTVGVGVDAFGYLGLKLDGGKGTTGSGNTVVGASGEPSDSFGRAGAALKLRVSKTVLKLGDQQPVAPVFAVGGSRLLPQSANGITVMSSELSGLDVEAGRFTSSTSENQTNRDGEIWTTYAAQSARSATYVGGRYAFNDAFTASVYGLKLEDVFNQYYANLNYVLPLGSDQSLAFDFNYYNTRNTGSAKAGAIDNNSWSLAASYSFLAAHTVTLAFQKVNGNTNFDYVGVGDNDRGADSILLANASQYADFNGPGEKSAQVRYELNMAPYGVPGLSFAGRYVYGWGIDYSRVDASSAYYSVDRVDITDARHREIDVQAKYVVQSGPAKDLAVRLQQAWHDARNGQSDGDTSELRVIVDYPISIL